MMVCLQSDTIPISVTYSTPASLLNMNWGPDLPRSLDHMEGSMLTTEQIKIIGHCVFFFFRRQKPVHSSTLQVRLSHLELAMPPSDRKSELPWDPPHCSFVSPWLRFWGLTSISDWQSPPLLNIKSHSHTPSKSAAQAASLNKVLTARVILNTVCTFPSSCVTRKGPASCL